MIMSLNKNLVYRLVLITLFVFSGCNDKQENKTKNHVKTNVEESNAPIIEVVANENSKEIKVKQKDKTKIQVKDGKAYYYDYNINSEYDQNAQPANKDASVRIKPRTVLDANMHIRSPYERVRISLIVQQLSTNFKLKCSPCHDDYANGVVGPSLLGRDSTFIYNAINDFKNGKKSNPLMADLIHKMDDKQIKDIANEIYEFNKAISKLGAKE